MNIKLLPMIFLFFIILSNSAISQTVTSSDETLYTFFGPQHDLLFVQGIEMKILEAREKKDAKSLCAYSALLFYAENITGKKHGELYGFRLLNEALSYAWGKKDIQALMAAQAIWGSKFFGLNDSQGAEEIGKYIETLKREEPVPETTKPIESPKIDFKTDPTKPKSGKAVLLAEEYARIDAVEQIAERIFGVMIHSVTNVENFTTAKDVVISNLKSQLIQGAQFGSLEIKEDEVRIPVTVTKEAIIATMKLVLSQSRTTMSSKEMALLEKTLQPEYRAIGLGIISK